MEKPLLGRAEWSNEGNKHGNQGKWGLVEKENHRKNRSMGAVMMIYKVQYCILITSRSSAIVP